MFTFCKQKRKKFTTVILNQILESANIIPVKIKQRETSILLMCQIGRKEFSMKHVLVTLAALFSLTAHATQFNCTTADDKKEKIEYDDETEIVSAPSSLAGGKIYVFGNAPSYVRQQNGSKVQITCE